MKWYMWVLCSGGVLYFATLFCVFVDWIITTRAENGLYFKFCNYDKRISGLEKRIEGLEKYNAVS